MAGEPTRHRVSELIARGVLALGDGYRAKNSELGDQGLPFARAGNIDGQFLFDNADRVDLSNINIPPDKISRPDDTVFTSKGTVGRFARVTDETPQFVYSPQLCYWRSLNNAQIDAGYLYYWLSGPEFYSQYKGVSGQTDMADYVSLGDQRSMWITLPDIARQRSVANVLGSLDGKIDLNRRMAATLEEMARALFKSWFVDFDPVRAKAEGRDPGLPAATATLFPDTFSKDGLPVGWRERPFGDVFEIRNGNTPSTDEARYWGGDHYWATPKDLSPLKSPVLLRTDRTLSADGVSVVNSGLLPAGSVLISTRAPIGYLAFATCPVAINQGMAGIVGKELSTAYAWLWCAANIDTFLAVAGGSTFPEISKGTLRKLPMLVPNAHVSEAFAACVDPIVARLVELARENDQLATLRDTLLPRLISGGLRIKNGAAQGEAA